MTVLCLCPVHVATAPQAQTVFDRLPEKLKSSSQVNSSLIAAHGFMGDVEQAVKLYANLVETPVSYFSPFFCWGVISDPSFT